MNTLKKISALAITICVGVSTVWGGNPDRAGSAGAGHLLINPWARSSGLANSGMASINGIEAIHLNVAGLAFVRKTELLFTNTQYLVGTGIKINSLGFGQRVGENGAIGFSVASMSFGDIPITEVNLPEGGIGSFSPSYTNIGVSYAKGFSNSIFGGITMRLISESISNVRAQGAAFDAGIRYVTGENDQLRFGIALKNVGPPMRYRGDGLSITAVIPTTGTDITLEQRSEKYELPSLVNVGFAYDFILAENMKLTANLQYTSNSFTRDQYGVGGEFSFRERFILRAGYQWEDGVTSEEERTTVFVGPHAGLTVQVPTSQSGSVIGLDYSYRVTNPFDGVHSIGAHITL
jgi:Type IX secretion system protein PorV